MNPDELSKLSKRFDEVELKLEARLSEHDDKWESRLSAHDDVWERRFADLTITQDARVSALERVAGSVEDWRPDIEGTLDTVRLEVGKLSKHWERSVMDRNTPLLDTVTPAAGRPPAAGEADRPNGHRVHPSPREGVYGSVTTVEHPPAKGMSCLPDPPVSSMNTQFYHYSGHPGHGSNDDLSWTRLPKLNFPSFDGDNPKLWLSRTTNFMEFCRVPAYMWVKLASMHIIPPASRGLPSVEARLKSCSWNEFAQLLLDRFGREHHELLVRQFLSIKQTGSVADYIESFSALVDQLIAYEARSDPLHYTMRFIDGLREDLRAAVLLQRPSDLDTAFVLAQLQDEVSQASRRRDYKKYDYAFSPKSLGAAPLPLPTPPKSDKLKPPVPDDGGRSRVADERWKSLRAHRRAQGLCQFCAEKWTRGHTCADKVQLHAVQELLQAFQISDDCESVPGDTDIADHQLFLTLSVAAFTGQSSSRSMCMAGEIQGAVVRILVDSGSSHTFVNSTVAAQLSGMVELKPPLMVKVANGHILQCSSFIPDCAWSISGVSFHNDLKVIPLASYDMILGLDWLEQYSPMEVHWKQHWMAIPYHDSVVVLHGELNELPEGSVVQLCSVLGDSTMADDGTLPPEIQSLLEEFAAVFVVPTELPPPRACDHSIPLVEGAVPVNVRPYRFAPAVKDEIEKKIKEMLASGLIQRSVSPFSSSVLLVRKKDMSWRFCVDYRHLNAITIKAKYPVPIIDEFLDELASATWFSCLDLRYGFHQIRLKPGEEFKTAFQTHCGHFEFRVLAFGLTGAPGTFQAAMNASLSPYLRKFVLLFFDDILIYSRSYEEHLIHLRLVFEVLVRDKWLVKRSKCTFAQRRIHYLGHVLSEAGVSTDPSKIAAVAQWPQPANVKELRSFWALRGTTVSLFFILVCCPSLLQSYLKSIRCSYGQQTMISPLLR